MGDKYIPQEVVCSVLQLNCICNLNAIHQKRREKVVTIQIEHSLTRYAS